MMNTKARNENAPARVEQIAQWHHDRNLIDGAVDETQFTKLLEEMLELRLSISPGMEPMEAIGSIAESLGQIMSKGRMKTAANKDGIQDDIGDISVVLINIAERNGLTLAQCLDHAYSEIKNRKGKMVDGIFVKEADL